MDLAWHRKEALVHGRGRGSLVIAHVLGCFQMGGAEQVALDLAASQRAAGHRVLAIGIAMDPGGPRERQLLERGVEVHLVPRRAGFDITLIPRLSALFRRNHVSIVHTHDQQPLIYAAPAARLAGVPVCHTKHGDNLDMGRRLWLRRAGAACVNAYVVVSDATAEEARAHREAPSKKLRVILNGIDLSRFRPDPEVRAEVRSELAIAPDAWVVGTVGRLAPVKNQALLLRAAAPMLSADARLVVVGDGPEAGPLHALSEKLGISDRVLFLGERHDVPRLLRAFDTFALSSWTEGLPLGLLEAMATALPVVATAVGGVPAVIADGETGLLVRPNDAGALGAALAELMADPARAARMGREGRAAALAGYSSEAMASRYMELYESLLSKRARRRAGAPARLPPGSWPWRLIGARAGAVK
jgi:sugar transferase (PEP-CTERM/EpsH1 system associated)